MVRGSIAEGVPVGVEVVHAGGQSPAEVEDHEAALLVVGRDLLNGEDPREHLGHEPEKTLMSAEEIIVCN